PFNRVYLYAPNSEPQSFVLFLSGDGGWEQRVINWTDDLVKENAFVVGVVTPSYLKRMEHSTDPICIAKDLLALSNAIQTGKGWKKHFRPVLLGYSSGATLAYVALAQAPSEFSGALSLGFCPELRTPNTFCGVHSKMEENGLDRRFEEVKD